MVFLFFAVPNTAPALGHLSPMEKLSRIDIPGTLILIPCIICLILALQWGGSTYAWSDGRIIALLVLFGVLLLVFIGIQIWRQEAATVPPRIVKNRTIVGAWWYSFCLGSSFMVMIYYLSIWFQAVKGDTAIVSGYSTLPFVLSLVVASIGSGIFVTKIGYYNPSLLAGAILAPIAAGCMTLFKPDTNHSMWIGLQFLFGFGVGVGLQQTNIAAQTVLNKADAPTGVSLVFLGQGLGGAISVAVGQNILNSQLIKGLSKLGNIDPQQVVNNGATQLRTLFNADQLVAVTQVYNDAIIKVFYCATAFACLCSLGAVVMEWKSTKVGVKAKGNAERQAEAQEPEPEQKHPEAIEDDATDEKPSRG